MAAENINECIVERRIGMYEPPIDIVLNDENIPLTEHSEIVNGDERLRKQSNWVLKSRLTDEPVGLVADTPNLRRNSNASRKSSSLDEPNSLSVADTGGSRRASNASGKDMSLDESTRLSVDEKGSGRGSSNSRKSNSLDEPMGILIDQRGSRSGSDTSGKRMSLEEPLELLVEKKGSRRESKSSRKSSSLDEFSGLNVEDADISPRGKGGTQSDEFDQSGTGRNRSGSNSSFQKNNGVLNKETGADDYIFTAGKRDSRSPRRLGRQVSEDKIVMDLSNTSSGDIMLVEARMQSIHSGDPGIYPSSGFKAIKQSSQEERGSGDSLVHQVGSTETPARPPRLRTVSIPADIKDQQHFLPHISENLSKSDTGKFKNLNSDTIVKPMMCPKSPVLVNSNQVRKTSLGYSETVLNTISEIDSKTFRELDASLSKPHPTRESQNPSRPSRKKSRSHSLREVKDPSRPSISKTIGLRHQEKSRNDKSSLFISDVTQLIITGSSAIANSLKRHDTSNEGSRGRTRTQSETLNSDIEDPGQSFQQPDGSTLQSQQTSQETYIDQNFALKLQNKLKDLALNQESEDLQVKEEQRIQHQTHLQKPNLTNDKEKQSHQHIPASPSTKQRPTSLGLTNDKEKQSHQQIPASPSTKQRPTSLGLTNQPILSNKKAAFLNSQAPVLETPPPVGCATTLIDSPSTLLEPLDSPVNGQLPVAAPPTTRIPLTSPKPTNSITPGDVRKSSREEVLRALSGKTAVTSITQTPRQDVIRASAISYSQTHSFSSFLSANKSPTGPAKSIVSTDNEAWEIPINKSNTLPNDVQKLKDTSYSVKEKAANNVQLKENLTRQNNYTNSILSPALDSPEPQEKQQKETTVQSTPSKTLNFFQRKNSDNKEDSNQKTSSFFQRKNSENKTPSNLIQIASQYKSKETESALCDDPSKDIVDNKSTKKTSSDSKGFQNILQFSSRNQNKESVIDKEPDISKELTKSASTGSVSIFSKIKRVSKTDVASNNVNLIPKPIQRSPSSVSFSDLDSVIESTIIEDNVARSGAISRSNSTTRPKSILKKTSLEATDIIHSEVAKGISFEASVIQETTGSPPTKSTSGFQQLFQRSRSKERNISLSEDDTIPALGLKKSKSNTSYFSSTTNKKSKTVFPLSFREIRLLRDARSGDMKGSMDNALLVLCRIGEEDQVLRLLKELTASSTLDTNMVNRADKTGRTSLSYACSNGFQRVVEYMTALEGTDINKPDTEGHTPLHYAAQAGNVEVVSHLVNKCHRDVDLDARNNLGFTPLMKSALQGRTKCAKMLLFAGASPHLRDTGRGLNAMEWAKYTQRHVCCELIESIQKSCSSHIKDRWASDPDLKGDVPGSLNALSQQDKDSWIKHKIKKAFKGSDGGSVKQRGNVGIGGECMVADKLSSMAVCATTPLLPQAVAQDLKPSINHHSTGVPSLQITEVKVADCYEEPEDPPIPSNKSTGQPSGTSKSNTTKSSSSNSKTSTGGKKKK